MIGKLNTPCGILYVSGNNDYIEKISWESLEGKQDNKILLWMLEDLKLYVGGKAKAFSGGLTFLDGQPVWMREKGKCTAQSFLHKVLIEVSRIPYGQVMTYGAVARKLRNARLARAVGQACKINPLPIIVPCHRVIGKDSLVGYAGGLDKKRYLLDLEKNR
jgi:O-6-methylguanine DNA methyltransferase